MIEVRPDERDGARELFLPDRPGPLAGLHTIQTGLGLLLADRWPEPRTVLAAIGDDVQLAGDPEVLKPDDLRSVGIEQAMIDARPEFVPLLESVFAGVWRWPRVIARLDAQIQTAAPEGAEVRRLGWDDARGLGALDESIDWISNTWEGPSGLAGSGFAFGAFVDGQLVSVAAPFSMGEHFEDIGVVTEAAFRRRGLNAACVSRVVADIRERGRTPSWTTTPDNEGSLGVAAKFGAKKDRDDVLYMVGWDAAP